MFRYFPTNYVWNLSVDLAIEMGARMGEIEEMCAPLQEAAKQPDAMAPRPSGKYGRPWPTSCAAWPKRTKPPADACPCGEKYNRAATYYLTCERLQAHGAPGRAALYQRFLDTFARGIDLAKENCERVEIPYEGKHLSGLLVRAEGVSGPAPLLVQVNGLDSTKEMKYRVGLPAWLARRGVSSLIVDQPGTGEALRLHGMTARHDSEHWASRIVDWLETRADVDARRIGLEGVSLGGYYCPRAVAFEPRFACGVVWGANHDWRDVQKRRLEKEGNFPVPHYWAHVQWVWGRRTWTTSCASPKTYTSTVSSTVSTYRSWSPTARKTRRSRSNGHTAPTSNWSTARNAN